MPEAAEALTEEREFFEEHFDEYREKYPGRHLLIVGRQLMGHYATREEAVAAGYEIEGIDAMLVQESGTRPPVRFLPTVLSSLTELKHYARQYGEGKVTLARAASDAGVSLWEMMDYARARKVPAQYEVEDLQRDLETISAASASREQ